MADLVTVPSIIEAKGNKPKYIQEFIGLVNTHNEDISIAKMVSPEGWSEPGQTAEFDEYTVVLKGILCVKTTDSIFEVKTGQVLLAKKGEWVQYSSPYEKGAEYMSVCIPAFSPGLVKRDNQQ